MSGSSFFRTLEITDLRLRVRHLEDTLGFYRDVLGLRVLAREGGTARLAASESAGPALVELVEAPEAPVPPPGAVGLFHVAFLVPDRPALGDALRRLHEAGWPLQGAADHGVSEALYTADPEGNGIEIYADRPPELWPRADADDDQVTMFTEPLPLAEILGAAQGEDLSPGTRIGHVHLRVADLAGAERFFAGQLGLPVRQRSYPGALFFGADGYHHHIGANVWGGRRLAPEGALGLDRFTIRLAGSALLEGELVSPEGLRIELEGRDSSLAARERRSAS
jgi:catechol 2,3-dioxygenase